MPALPLTSSGFSCLLRSGSCCLPHRPARAAEEMVGVKAAWHVAGAQYTVGSFERSRQHPWTELEPETQRLASLPGSQGPLLGSGV